jgi:hypothetical protein
VDARESPAWYFGYQSRNCGVGGLRNHPAGRYGAESSGSARLVCMRTAAIRPRDHKEDHICPAIFHRGRIRVVIEVQDRVKKDQATISFTSWHRVSESVSKLGEKKSVDQRRCSLISSNPQQKSNPQSRDG